MALFSSVGLHATEDSRFNKSNTDGNTDSNISELRLLIQRNLELTEENKKFRQLLQEKNANYNYPENSNIQLLKDSVSVFINVFFGGIVGVCVGNVIATVLNARNGRN